MIRIMLIGLIILWGATAFAQIPLHDITHITTPMKLSGEWGFAEGKALLPEQTDSLTQTLYLPQYLEKRQGAKGVVTFVLDLKTTPNQPLSLDFNPLVNPWKIFIDNHLLCESGIIDPQKKIYLASPKRQIVTFTPNHTQTRITLWVANSQHRHFGLGVSPIIAPAGTVEASHTSIANFNLAIISVFLAAGLYHLGLFWAWRRDKAPLWFGLFLLVFAVRVSVTSEKIATTLFDSLTWDLLTRIEYISGYLTLLLFILYISSLFPRQSNTTLRILNITIAGVFVLMAILTPTLFFTATMPFTELVIIQSLLFVVWILYHAFKAQEPYSTFALVTFVIFSGTIFHDILMFAQKIDDTQDWSPIGFVVYSFSQVAILLRQYAHTFHTLKEHENELDGIIAKRTHELNHLLSQRELLMRELSHRVKNNLQFIISLLWTKRSSASDETQKILLSLQSQIQAIATVHETLCEQPNMTMINGGNYLQTITNALSELYPNITFICNFGKEGVLVVEDTISLGLVVSELISNSIKHVFTTNVGTIHIDFAIDQNMATFSYRDGHTPFEDTAFFLTSRNNKRLGWSMIMELVSQLQAKIVSKETTFSLHFSIKRVHHE